MRKAILLVIVLAVALGIAYLLLHHNNSEQSKTDIKDIPLSISSKTSAFNRSFAVVLNNYYALSNAFVSEDTVLIRNNADLLNRSIDSIRFEQFKADSAIVLTAVSLAQSMQGDISGLKGEKTLELKRKEFNMITDELYSLVRTIKYDANTVYHMRCATAFSDSTEGYWLSPTSEINNPYLGKNHPVNKDKMTECGELSDSIHFSVPANE